MALTAGHYNVILKGKWNGGQDILNSFYVNLVMNGGTLVGDDAEFFNVGKRLWDAIKSNLRSITVNIVTYNTLEVFKADGVDVGASGFYTIPSNEQAGAQSGDPLPPFVAWSFQYTRPNANYRHGYKRFAGIREADQANGVATTDVLVYLNGLATTLASSINLNAAVGIAPYIEPALVQRVKNGQPVDPDVWYKPATVVYKKIGSQNTRKYNVGS